MSSNTVKLVAVGDLFLGEHAFTLGHGVASVVKKKGCDFLFDDTKEYLNTGDIVCGNLEGVISPRLDNDTAISTAMCWGEPSCASAMKNAGFNCLFLANNHAAQHGVDTLKRTCDLLDQNDIKWTGYNSTEPDKPIPVIFDVRDIKVGLVAYCETQQYHLDTKILPIINLENIKKDIGDLRKKCDVVVVSLHWGEEFIDYPSPEQTKLAYEIIDSGAQLILGHHSHVMQGIEKYKNGLIVYSLGTFVKDLWRKELRESVIFSCELSKEGVGQYNIVPICVDSCYQPKPYKGQDASDFKSQVDSLSQKIQSNKLRDPEELQKQYFEEVNNLTRIDKFDNLKYYVKNIFRYDRKLLLKNVILMLKRRIYRRNI